jgi:hypothetical protein
MLGGKMFDNPKPLPLMIYLLGAFPSHAVVLDFFAGSGTTAHAIAYLNSQDGGTRQAILVTDNSAKVGKKYIANGGKSGICRRVTQPRIRAALTGKWADHEHHSALSGSLRFYTTDFLRRRRNNDQLLIDLGRAAVDVIAVKEGVHDKIYESDYLTVLFRKGKAVAVVTDSLSEHAELAYTAGQACSTDDERTAYLFTWADEGVEPEIAEQWAGWAVKPLPAPLLAAIRRGINIVGVNQ